MNLNSIDAIISNALTVQGSYNALREENIELQHKIEMLEKENQSLVCEVLGKTSLTSLDKKLIEYGKEYLIVECFYTPKDSEKEMTFEEYVDYGLILSSLDHFENLSKKELLIAIEDKLRLKHKQYIEKAIQLQIRKESEEQ